MGVFYVAMVCAITALLIPRSLPRTVRSAIWSSVLLVVVLLSANLERITPPDEAVDLLNTFQYDRAVTVVFALALTALFFPPSSASVTFVCIGCLPMLMIILVRDHTRLGGDKDAVIIWGALMLMMLASQARQLTAMRHPGIPSIRASETGRRLTACVLLIGCAWLLAFPLTGGAYAARGWLFGLMRYQKPRDRASANADMLSLKSPTAEVAGKTRMLMEIDAPGVPGYLREAVYLKFNGHDWARRPDRGMRTNLQELAATGEGDLQGFAIIETDQETAVADYTTWHIDVLSSSRISSFCLPGQAAVLLMAEGQVAQADNDGIIFPEEQIPHRFSIRLPRFFLDPAYPLPPLAGQPEDYLSIPSQIAPAVSEWVNQCTGLAASVSATEAVALLTSWFAENFSYSLEPLPRGDSPLEVFMQLREGHCTLFASAAALMLRRAGIPTRVVAGYLSNEKHPLTGKWTVRERDGHAWCEAWDRASGRWILMEATPPGGLPGGFGQPGYHQLALEGIRSLWKRFVRRLQSQNPLILVAEAGIWVYFMIAAFLGTAIGRLAVAALAILIVVRMVRRRRHNQAGDPDARLRARLIRRMRYLERRYTHSRLRRLPSEPWTTWAQRIAPVIPEPQSKRLRDLLEDYQKLRYAPRIDSAQAQKWLCQRNSSIPGNSH